MADKHIVVCDDDEIVFLSVKSIMEKMGYTVHEAHDGKTALRLAATHMPAVIFQDIQMPGMDGFEVCRRIKSDSSTRQIALVFVSAMEFEQALEPSLKSGADFWVSKPFSPNDLAADLYFLAEANFHPDYPSLTKLRITRSLAMERQKKRAKGVAVPAGEGIEEPRAAEPQQSPASAPGILQLSRQVAGLVKRIQALESMLHEKRILSDSDTTRLKEAGVPHDPPGVEEMKKDNVSWEG